MTEQRYTLQGDTVLIDGTPLASRCEGTSREQLASLVARANHAGQLLQLIGRVADELKAATQ